MPEARHARTDRTLIAMGVAVVVAALIAPALGTCCRRSRARNGATPPRSGADGDVCGAPAATAIAAGPGSPSRRSRRSRSPDIDQALAESSPDPQEHDHGTVGALSTTTS